MKFSDYVTEEQFNSMSEVEFQDLLWVMQYEHLKTNKGGLRKENPVVGDLYMDANESVYVWVNKEWMLLN